MATYAVIMAGGVGSRFWPQSREAFPKQFLSLHGSQTLIQQTVHRIKELIPLENVLVITNKKYVSLVHQQLPDLPAENIYGEPMAKNTAPCIGLAASVIQARDPEGVMVVLPSDHIITQEADFLSTLSTAVECAKNEGAICTIGIEPSRAETGYGYIQYEKNTEQNGAFKVDQFKEKPDVETAQSYVDSGSYLWNSGMFIWKASTILTEIEKNIPDLFVQCQSALKAVPKGALSEEMLYTFFDASPSISVDYGVMEHAKEVFVVPGDFGWNDVGSWLAVYELNEKDEDDNVVSSAKHVRMVKTLNSYVNVKSEKMVALVGLKDVAVIETDDALLICNLNESQAVKDVVNSLTGEDKRFK